MEESSRSERLALTWFAELWEMRSVIAECLLVREKAVQSDYIEVGHGTRDLAKSNSAERAARLWAGAIRKRRLDLNHTGCFFGFIHFIH